MDTQVHLRYGCTHRYRSAGNELSAFFIKQSKRWIPKTADEDALADFCIATVQGAMLMGKIQRSSRPVETTVAETIYSSALLHTVSRSKRVKKLKA